MDNRTNILKTITANKPAQVPLPDMPTTETIRYGDPFEKFKSVLESIGGQLHELKELATLKEEIAVAKQEGKKYINMIPELGETDTYSVTASAHLLALVDKAYIRGTIAVAENGAIWIKETDMGNRLLPFICQHLVLLIDKKNIVDNLHIAYERINCFEQGFGVFIAGPSKTADIEQSLVIGAHGARSLLVYLKE